MASSKIYTLDWSGKRLNEMMAAVAIPDEDFCRELGLKPHGLARWREEGVPKKYMKRVAKLLGWNLVYPDFDKAPIGTWVKKQGAAGEQKSEPAPEGFRIAEPEEKIQDAPKPLAVKQIFVDPADEDVTCEVTASYPSGPVVWTAPSIPDLARHQIVATPTLEQKPRKPVGFRND